MALRAAARSLVLEGLLDAVIVLDEQDRLGDLNHAAHQLLVRAVPAGRPVVGLAAREAFGGLTDVLGVEGRHHVHLRDGQLDLDVRISMLVDDDGQRLGRVLVVHDVSAVVAQQRLMTGINDALREQLVINERLRAEVAEQAVRDPLTGLHNRRYLNGVLADHADRALQDGTPLSLAIFDVDHFKRVNDVHGHAVGDRLLEALGRQLLSVLRGGDTVARYGGEEFVVLFAGVASAEAVRRTEEIRLACAQVVLRGLEALGSPSLSAGVASWGDGVASGDDLLEAADQALYRAKAAGRDCTVGQGPRPGVSGRQRDQEPPQESRAVS